MDVKNFIRASAMSFSKSMTIPSLATWPIRFHHPFKSPLKKNEQDTKRRRRHKARYMVRASTIKRTRCLASQCYIFSAFKESEMVFNFSHLLPTIRCYDTERAVRGSESEEQQKSD